MLCLSFLFVCLLLSEHFSCQFFGYMSKPERCPWGPFNNQPHWPRWRSSFLPVWPDIWTYCQQQEGLQTCGSRNCASSMWWRCWYNLHVWTNWQWEDTYHVAWKEAMGEVFGFLMTMTRLTSTILAKQGGQRLVFFFFNFFFAKTAAFSRVFLLLPNPPPPWNPGVLKSSFFSNQKKMVFFVHGAAGSRPQVCHWRDGDFRGFCSSGTIRRQWLGALGPVPTFRDFFFGTNSTHLKWVLGTFPPTKMGKMMQSWFFV